jgi:hypothetical protein
MNRELGDFCHPKTLIFNTYIQCFFPTYGAAIAKDWNGRGETKVKIEARCTALSIPWSLAI